KKVLVLMDNDENVPVHVHVREDWLMTPLCIGDIIHIPLPGQERPLRMIVDNENNFIITCPDKLLSITAVAGSYLCLRKSVLQQKTSGPSEYSQPLVHGDIMHQVFQYALKTSDFSESTLRTELLRVIRSSLIPLLAIGQDEEEAFVIMKDYIDTIRAFGDIYIGLYPKRNATLADNTNTSRTKSKLDIDTLSISRILDIEENLWSPTYGIKGMLDATIEIKTSPNKKTLIVPFELKTGKPTKSIAHCAQTILYTLLMSDRYDTSIDVGALLYSRSNSFFILPASRNEMKSLIMARNNLALALSNQETLPPMIKSLHTCQMCNMSNTCLAFHKAVEGGDSASSGLSKWFDLKTEQIRPEDAAFFRHWQSLIDLEEENVDNLRKDIWTQPGELRELEGKCLNNMKMSKPLQNDDENFTRSFYRDPAFESKNNVKPLSHSQIGKGDPVIISSTSGHVNLGMGSVLFISANLIRIQLTRPMRRVPKKGEGFDDDFNQVYERPKSEDGATYNTYRIDIDNVSIGMGTLRHNIVALVSKDEDGGDEKRKRLIVDLETPNFVNNDLEHISNTTELNTDQQAAVMKVLSAKDYALILGMPGTGKTTTMAHIIKELIMQNKSVLVAAYTHTALDNVLLKVRESGIDVLRIGNPLKNNPALDSIQAIKDFYKSKKVIRNEHAKSGGLEKSLFDLLAEAHPQSVVYLKYQYRMNKDIMKLCNTLIYDNKLKCGNNQVAMSSLEIPQLNKNLEEIHKSQSEKASIHMLCSGVSCWLKDILDPR
ncbi:DNA replication factor Dna2-domain-containing protein, partial [Phycomyces blakesleeanus]